MSATQEELQQLVERIESKTQEISALYLEIRENNERVDQFCQDMENSDFEELFGRARQHLDSVGGNLNYNMADPEDIKRPELREQYLALSELDRRLLVASSRMYLTANLPFDSTHGYGDHVQRKLDDFNAAVNSWEQN